MIAYIAFFAAISLIIPNIALEQSVENQVQTPGEMFLYPLLRAHTSPPLPEELLRIAECESNGRHFDETGKVLLGRWNKYDVGKYQINIKYWGEEAKRLGYDLLTEEGNEAMALELYRKYHTKPWTWSKKCWSR